MADWQPIETAPRDGTHMLARDGKATRVVCWSRPSWAWLVVGTTDEIHPDHWHPLPAPPSEGEVKP